MLFHTFTFILFFFPIAVLGYFVLVDRRAIAAAKWWMLACSLFFYGWWSPIYVPFLVGFLLFNFFVGRRIAAQPPDARAARRRWLWLAIGTDLGLLAYFKYTNFLLSNVAAVTGQAFEPLAIVLPLGISFHAFQMIAYQVDVYRGDPGARSVLDLQLFISFFPHLLAGPIVHHKELIPQFEDAANHRIDWHNASVGFFVFFVGLAKKVVIADTFAVWANHGFESGLAPGFFEAWLLSLAYTFQLYFDFSGYCDMATGAALFFNIRLPVNFDSPYKSLDLQEFWRRWHVTLGRFLRDYVYIPLGGNRGGEPATLRNLMITFLLGGLWHGAGWTFVFWGFLHGLGLVVHRLWSRSGRSLPAVVAWAVTFVWVDVAWVFFRAPDWETATRIVGGMFGANGFALHEALAGRLGALWPSLSFATWPSFPDSVRGVPWILAGLLIVLALPNSLQLRDRFRFDPLHRWATVAMAILGLMSLGRVSEFLYFQF